MTNSTSKQILLCLVSARICFVDLLGEMGKEIEKSDLLCYSLVILFAFFWYDPLVFSKSTIHTLLYLSFLGSLPVCLTYSIILARFQCSVCQQSTWRCQPGDLLLANFRIKFITFLMLTIGGYETNQEVHNILRSSINYYLS